MLRIDKEDCVRTGADVFSPSASLCEGRGFPISQSYVSFSFDILCCDQYAVKAELRDNMLWKTWPFGYIVHHRSLGTTIRLILEIAFKGAVVAVQPVPGQ